MRVTLLTLLLASTQALRAISSPQLVRTLPAAARASTPRAGFEVETLDDEAVKDMNIFNWPGLEKRTNDFEQDAAADEMKMVYIKDGSATISDGEETQEANAGQIVMISDGTTRWSLKGDESVTLISMTTALDDVTGDGAGSAPAADDLEPLTPKDYAFVLGAGLLVGGIFAFATKMAQ